MRCIRKRVVGVLLAVCMGSVMAHAAPLAPEAKKDQGIRVLLASEQETVLAAQMAGRVGALHATLGSAFNAGANLLHFDCEEQEARLKMAEAELYGAQSTYESKVKLQSLQSVGELEVQQAAAAVEKFRAQIQMYKAQVKLCSVNAPFSGRVSKLRVKPYESVSVGQPLLEIVNDRRLKLQLNVPSSWLAQVKVGTSFAVTVDETGTRHKARVLRINGKVDAVSQSIELEGEIQGNAKGLLPGMSGVATFDSVQ